MTVGLHTIILLGMQLADAGEVSVSAKGHATNPMWSAKGDKLAFEINDQTGNIELYAADMANGQSSGVPKRVTLNVGSSSFGGSGGVVTAAPVWHPKQDILFFEGSHKGGSNRIYVHSFTGAPPRQAVAESAMSGDLSWPAINSDGSKLVFISDFTGSGDVYTLDLKNWKDTQRLTDSEDDSEMAPRFDAGANIVYTRKRNAGEDVFLYKDGVSSDWVGGDGDQTRPNFAGASLVFFSSERGNDMWDVVVSTAPGKKTTLAKNVRLPFRAPPALSPDGQWVAYGMEATDKSSKIWLTKLDGSKTVGVTTPHVACGEPALTSINGRVFLAYTALPSEGSDWRQVHTVDITDQLK